MSDYATQILDISRTVSTGTGTLLNVARDLGIHIPGDNAGQWMRSLQPASWRGIPIVVQEEEGTFGRRNAVHEYPYRDDVWPEDLGRAARRITLSGFLVGDDVISQRERLIAAAEAKGEGELVHPSLGRMTVSLLDCKTSSTWERGRVVMVRFQFVESGKRIFPIAATSTSDATKSAATAANSAASSDYAASLGADLKKGAAVALQVANTAASWARKAQRLVNDCTNLSHLSSTLTGQFGRYHSGRVRSGYSSSTSLSSLIAAGAVTSGAATVAISALTSTASDL